jgi:plasmid maintenance system killer protein
MQHSPVFLAFDLGAESGRLMAGHLQDNHWTMEEIHRFRNGPVPVGNHLHWDILRLWDEMQTGLAKAGSRYGKDLASLGVDTWGVDFGLLAKDGTLLGNPFHYRDARTNGMVETASRLVSREVQLPGDVQQVAYRKLRMIHNAQNISDLRIPPANRLEKLLGKKMGQYSIRINEQWRICFEWHDGDAYDVEIVDYH